MIQARDLLIEIGTEELPPKSLPLLSQALESEFLAQIGQAGLGHGATTRYAAPRRLALLVSALASRQVHQSGLGEKPQMPRQPWLRLPENFGEIGNCQFGLGKQRQDPQARGLAGGFQGGRHAGKA